MNSWDADQIREEMRGRQYDEYDIDKALKSYETIHLDGGVKDMTDTIQREEYNWRY